MSDGVKFTPGPWDAYEVPTSINVRSKRGGRIARMAISPISTMAEEGRANAILMAAAPTMHESLQIAEYAITEWVADTECKINHEGLVKALKRIRAALKSAEVTE